MLGYPQQPLDRPKGEWFKCMIYEFSRMELEHYRLRSSQQEGLSISTHGIMEGCV